MQGALEVFLASNILAFMLTFARVGTAMMIMPGVGDSFVPERIRLYMAVGLSFVLFPLLLPYMPSPVPAVHYLTMLIGMEVLVGLFIGSIARIFMGAMDTAGMIISTQAGLSNAQVFNPSLSSQGSIMGAFLSVTGVVVLFSVNLHHLLIMAVVESYEFFPLGELPSAGSMAEMISKTVTASFMVGVKLASPFIVMTLIMYVAMGVLSRLMPQVQVFMIALPLQIWMSLILLTLVLTAIFYHWLGHFEEGMVYFLSNVNSQN